MVDIAKNNAEIEAKILAGLKSRVEGQHIDVGTATLDHVDFAGGLLRAIEAKLAKEQEIVQKQFEKEIAVKNAEIATIKANSDAASRKIRAEAEAESHKILAAGQAESQKLIDETLTPRFLQFKAFDSPNAKFIYVPLGKEGLPLILNAEQK